MACRGSALEKSRTTQRREWTPLENNGFICVSQQTEKLCKEKWHLIS